MDTATAALVGAIIGAAGTWLIEWERRRQERRARWLVERRALYAAVLRTFEDYAEAAFGRVRDLDWVSEGLMRPEDVRAQPDVEPVHKAFSDAEILVAPESEVALLRLQWSLHGFWELMHPHPGPMPSTETVERVRKDYREARHGFKEAIRRELIQSRRPRRKPGPVRRALRRVKATASDLWSRL